MLFLNARDIESALDKVKLIDQMEEGMRLLESEKVLMPPRSHLNHHSDTLLLMPCFGDSYFSTKLVSIFPGNQGTDFPVVNGMVVLNDGKTGAPVAILEGQTLTGIRTGAVGAVGFRHLTPETPQVVGLVGTGVQGFQQIRFAAATRRIEAVYLYNRNQSKVSGFIEKLAQEPELDGVELRQAKDVEELLTHSQTVIAATSSTTPVLPERPELFKGRTVIGVGSYQPDMREFPKAVFENAEKMLMDSPHAGHESGDVITPMENGWIDDADVQSMGKFLLQDAQRLTQSKVQLMKQLAQGRTLIYKSVGMAVFDFMAAVLIFINAHKKGLGQQLTL